VNRQRPRPGMPLAGCTSLICDRRSSDFFLVSVVLDCGSYTDCYCSRLVLKFHHA
jgi:hypothetical protein